MALKWRCILSVEKILTSYEEIDEALLQPGDVAFDIKPDLPLGHYRWNGERFDPADLGQVWYTPAGPDSWYAIFRALVHLQQQGIANFPPPVKLWMRYYYDAFKRPNDPAPPA